MHFIQRTDGVAEALVQRLDERVGEFPRWNHFMFASAWVNGPGMTVLEDSLRRFLASGGDVRGTVGVDFAGSTDEGLRKLVELQAESEGRMEVYVYKNESPQQTFHPKVYLFDDGKDGFLLVGSNNLTFAGLTTNVESSLAVEGPCGDEPFLGAKLSFHQWQTVGGPVLRLNAATLDKLRGRGYVQTDAAAAKARARSITKSLAPEERLFPTIMIRSSFDRVRSKLLAAEGPSKGTVPAPAVPPSTTDANYVIFKNRGRKNRETQIQVPKELRFSPFIGDATHIRSAHNLESHEFRVSTSGGKPNYFYFEAPETKGMPQDGRFLILYWQHDQLWYRAVSSKDKEGRKFERALAKGRTSSPPKTHDSKPNQPGTQSWRFMK